MASGKWFNATKGYGFILADQGEITAAEIKRMSEKSIKTVLLVEDDPSDARLLREMLNENCGSLTHEVTCVGRMSEAETHLKRQTADVILIDLGLPDARGLEAIRRTRAVAPGIPLVVLTGTDDEELATRALQEGAQDYLIKGQIDFRGLLRALRYATERKRLDEYVSTVSHELRTPLTSIIGSLDLLMGKAVGVLSDPAADLLRIAHRNSQRLVRLVNDILDLEKLESGHVVFDINRVEVRSLVEQTVESITAFAEHHRVKIRIEATSAVDKVRADTDRLAQVITNLLSNAVKFSAPDGEVVVAIESGIDLVRISVRDHGPGISTEFKSRVFDKFAQADATNARRKDGTGLGLSIVKEIVDRLGGTVGFVDAPGGGTIFYVELPIWIDLPRNETIRVAAFESSGTFSENLAAISGRLAATPARAAKVAV